MSQPVIAHKMEVIAIYPCPECGRDTPLAASAKREKAKCPGCGATFDIKPIDGSLYTILQDTFDQCMSLIPKPKPEPVRIPTFCFDIASPTNRFAYNRVIVLDDLLKSYSKDPLGADQDYKGKKYCFMGALDEIGIFESFVSASVTTASADFTVFCDFAQKNDNFSSLEEGDIVCVQGTYQGLLDPLNPAGGVFNHCTLLGFNGRTITEQSQCPNIALELKPKSSDNPYDIHIIFRNLS
ncbi:MAG: hypothetical protein D6E12_07325 [Desulfovibrio sp.]|nr:MAG: hypothetical protein D6E12_07325 [Desulfovibrio sp.]